MENGTNIYTHIKVSANALRKGQGSRWTKVDVEPTSGGNDVRSGGD